MKKHLVQNQLNVKVLIIDDEVDICFLLSTLLKQKKIDTHYVNSLAEARIALSAWNAEIVFLDNHLPDGMGMNFIEHIKSTLPQAKIVMITAYDTADDRKNALSKGADSFIGKPFSRETIYRTIQELSN